MRVLFLGEGTLDGPARYLAAILKWCRLPFDHQPDQLGVPSAWLKKPYGLVVLSDYRYDSFAPRVRQWLTERVQSGMGLLMIGGWASFTGLVGGYAGTEIETLLPVRCIGGDDRVQKATGALLLPSSGLRPPSPGGRRSTAVDPLPMGEGGRHGDLGEGSPTVCGYHRATPKPGTRTTMVFRDLHYQSRRVILGDMQPALVLGQYGKGRTAAFLTDCAPHWAGGLVDWGSRRILVKPAPRVTVEVGDRYLKFFRQLLRWTAQI